MINQIIWSFLSTGGSHRRTGGCFNQENTEMLHFVNKQRGGLHGLIRSCFYIEIHITYVNKILERLNIEQTYTGCWLTKPL